MTPTTTPTAIPILLEPPPPLDDWLVAPAWPGAVMTMVSPALVMTEGDWDTVVEPVSACDDGGGFVSLELLEPAEPLLDPSPVPTVLS